MPPESTSHISITGLITREGGAYTMIVGRPEKHEDAYRVRIEMPGISTTFINGENAISTLISALKVIERQVYEPSSAIKALTTLTEDDYADLEVDFK